MAHDNTVQINVVVSCLHYQRPTVKFITTSKTAEKMSAF